MLIIKLKTIIKIFSKDGAIKKYSKEDVSDGE